MAGKSVTKQVTADDEWLCEAYMETDYSTLTEADFEKLFELFLHIKSVAEAQNNA